MVGGLKFPSVISNQHFAHIHTVDRLFITSTGQERAHDASAQRAQIKVVGPGGKALCLFWTPCNPCAGALFLDRCRVSKGSKQIDGIHRSRTNGWSARLPITT
jgi:hypothetical protein